MQKALCHVAQCCGQHLVLNWNWCQRLLLGYLRWGWTWRGIWGKQRLPVLLEGNHPSSNQSNYPDSQTPVFTPGLPFLVCQQIWWTLLTSLVSVSLESIWSFSPVSGPKLVECFLIEHHMRAVWCSGCHYGVLCRVKHSIERQEAISPPLKAPVMEVKWPVCCCWMKKKNSKWPALHRHAVHECWLTGPGP